jgi:hypothetical protein
MEGQWRDGANMDANMLVRIGHAIDLKRAGLGHPGDVTGRLES